MGGVGDEETTRRCLEIVKKPQGGGYGHVMKESTNFKRVDHSLCYLNDEYLMVTGSYIQDEKMHETSERYDLNKDRWVNYPNLNVGRSFHSSCSFEGRFIFVLCGLVIETRQLEITSEEDRG